MKDRLIYDNERHKEWLNSRKPGTPMNYNQVDFALRTLLHDGYTWKSLDGVHYDWYKGVGVCHWSRHNDEYMEGTWEGDCGAMWTFMDGGPIENTQNFCPECGRKCEVVEETNDE